MTDINELISSRPIDDLRPLTEEEISIVASYYDRLINGDSVMQEFVSVTHQRGFPDTDEFYHILGQFAEAYRNTDYVETALVETDYIPTITAAKLSAANGKFNELAEKSARLTLANALEASEKQMHLANKESQLAGSSDGVLIKKVEMSIGNMERIVKLLDYMSRDKVEQAVTVEDTDSV